MPNTNFDTILSTTLQNYRKKLEDNIFNRVPLFMWLNTQGRKKMEDGGERIVIPLMYTKNSTAQAYNGYELLDVTPQDTATAAEFTWKQYAVSVTISGREMRQNSGKTRVINLLEAKVQQAEKSLRTDMDVDAFSANGAADKGLEGLQGLVAIDPTTGTVGNIDRSTNSWWRNNSTTSVGSFAANGIDSMRTLYYNCSDQGQDVPDLGLTTQTVFEYYEQAALPHERFVNTNAADLGFQNLKYKGMTLMFDNNCPSGYMYMLNSNYLNLVTHKDADFRTGKFKEPENQDAKTAQIIWMGNMTLSESRRQGVLSGITA